MVTEVHILLTYNCSLRCKHCYVFSDQRAPGKISFSQVSRYLNDGRKMQGIEWIYFGGGEPFTQYPLLLKAIQRARKLNYRVGVETNGYFARTIEAGIRMLRPLKNMGVEDLRISNDRLHYKNPRTSPANNALSAAHELGIPTTEVRTSTPGVEEPIPYSSSRVDQVAEPSFMFAGRAAELLAEKYPGMEGVSLTSCPHPDLGNPERVFVDAYGFVQICPGIAIGNACQVPLNEILGNYEKVLRLSKQAKKILGINSEIPEIILHSIAFAIDKGGPKRLLFFISQYSIHQPCLYSAHIFFYTADRIAP